MTRMIEQVMRAAPVFPVIVIDDAARKAAAVAR